MTAELKNLYEHLIEEMIINGIEGMTPELKAIITNAPTAQKRAMILTILEENNPEHRLLCNKIQKSITASNASETKHIKDVVKMLREYVEVSATEVKEFGEVMTPISLVEEMLDTLPYEVWTNPNLKWLDPCNGVGTFVSVIIQRLMKGLVTFEADDAKRYKHIMENMIYVCELQTKNVFLYMYAFDPKDEYALNVYNGSYLDEGFEAHMLKLGAEKFDVIVMNPPYNDGTKSRAGTLWNKFIIKALETSLVKDGYLVAVHPSSWRNIDGVFKNVQVLLKSRQMLYLEIHNKKDGLKTFGAETRYDFYCLRNTINLGNFNTKIKCQSGIIERADLSKLEFIPNGMFDTLLNLTAKQGQETVHVIANSSYHTQRPYVNKLQSENYKFPVICRVHKNGELDFFYSSCNDKGHFGIPKLIWSNGRVISVGSYVDETGKYGLNQFNYGIVDNVNVLDRIKEAFDSKAFRAFMENCEVSDMEINRRVIATFRKDFWIDFLG